MKSSFLLVLACLISHVVCAQWQSNGNDIYNTNSGNVIIGITSSNNAKFRVYQSVGLGNSPQSSMLLSSISGLAGTTNIFMHNIWLVRNQSGNDWLTTRLHDGVSIDVSFLSPQVDTRVWWERDPLNNIQTWGDQSNTYLSIYKGNIGVGTVAPVSLFQVASGQAKTSIGDLDGSGPTLDYGTSYLGFNAARTGSNWTVNQDGANNGAGVIFSTILGDLCFGTIPTTGASDRTLTDNDIANNVKFRITSDGTVLAKIIKVQTNIFPDYVFKHTYRLRTLSEVNVFIEQNHRLPEMPSEEDVKKDGIDLGEVVKLQTKKIEELTLYLIQKDKELNAQAEKIRRLKKQGGVNVKQQCEIADLQKKFKVLMKSLNKNN